MKYIPIFAFVLYSCTAMPQIADDIEKIADNDAITIKVDKDALQKDTDVSVSVQVINKDPTSQASPSMH